MPSTKKRLSYQVFCHAFSPFTQSCMQYFHEQVKLSFPMAYAFADEDTRQNKGFSISLNSNVQGLHKVGVDFPPGMVC